MTGMVLGLVLTACGGSPDTAEPVETPTDSGVRDEDTGGGTDVLGDWDCTPDPDVTWAGFTDGFFSAYCRACHSVTTPDRRGAPEGVDFTDRAEVMVWAPRLKARVLDAGDMPLGGGVVEEDRVRFEGWLCHQVRQSREDR